MGAVEESEIELQEDHVEGKGRLKLWQKGHDASSTIVYEEIRKSINYCCRKK